MELQIKLATKNVYPIKGILIKGATPTQWIVEIERMRLSLEQSACYPIPNTSPNSVWGCLVVPNQSFENIAIGQHQTCQLVHQLLFIPEKASLFPNITTEEMDQILLSKQHLMHPDFGMVELFDKINWADFLAPIQLQEITIRKPSAATYIPKTVKTFQVYALSPEEMLEELEKYNFPTQQKLEHEPLNASEKARLFLLKKLFKKHQEGGIDSTQKRSLMDKLALFIAKALDVR